MRDLESLASRLETKRIGRSLELLEETGSTMDDARAALERGASDGLAIIANAQTMGRGSRGRPWQSPPGDDLYLSIVMRPNVPLERLSTMTLAVGLAVARTVEGFVGDGRVAVKWPNDVLVDSAKSAGILVESRASSAGVDGVIVGIGLDCNREAATLTDGARITSIGACRGNRVDRAEVAATLFLELERTLEIWERDGLEALLPELVSRLAFRGRAILLDEIEGELLGIAEDGSLVLRTCRGVETFTAGRISLPAVGNA